MTVSMKRRFCPYMPMADKQTDPEARERIREEGLPGALRRDQQAGADR